MKRISLIVALTATFTSLVLQAGLNSNEAAPVTQQEEMLYLKVDGKVRECTGSLCTVLDKGGALHKSLYDDKGERLAVGTSQNPLFVDISKVSLTFIQDFLRYGTVNFPNELHVLENMLLAVNKVGIPELAELLSAKIEKTRRNQAAWYCSADCKYDFIGSSGWLQTRIVTIYSLGDNIKDTFVDVRYACDHREDNYTVPKLLKEGTDVLATEMNSCIVHNQNQRGR
jgi:hypothetical protein